LQLLKVLDLIYVISGGNIVVGVVSCVIVVAVLGHVHVAMSHYVVLLDHNRGVCHAEDTASICIIKTEVDQLVYLLVVKFLGRLSVHVRYVGCIQKLVHEVLGVVV
jgi:hypothetical protein